MIAATGKKEKLDKEINRQIKQIVNLSNNADELIPRLQKFVNDLIEMRAKAIQVEAKVMANEVLAGGNIPKPFTGEFVSFLLVNALRNLDKEQFHNLATSLAVRDEKFSVDEYNRQREP